MKHFLSNNELSLTLALFVFLMPFGSSKFVPLLWMSVRGAQLSFATLTQPQQSFSNGERWLASMALCIWLPVLISLPFSIFPSDTLTIAAAIPIYFLAGLFITKQLQSGQRLELFGKLLLATSILWAASVVWEMIDPAPFKYAKYHAHQIQGLHSEAFHGDRKLGALVALLTPLLFAAFSATRRYAAPILAVSMALIFLSGTRAYTFAAFFTFPLLYFVFKTPNRTVSATKWLSALVLITITVYGISQHPRFQQNIQRTPIPTLDQLFEFNTWDRLSSYRLRIWNELIQLGAQVPLHGVGAGVSTTKVLEHINSNPGHLTIHSKAGYLNMHSHQIFVDTWYQTGLSGVIGLGILFVSVLVLLKRAISGINPDTFYSTENKLLIASIMGFMSVFLPFGTHYKLYGSWQMMWLFVLLGLMAGYKQLTQSKNFS